MDGIKDNSPGSTAAPDPRVPPQGHVSRNPSGPGASAHLLWPFAGARSGVSLATLSLGCSLDDILFQLSVPDHWDRDCPSLDLPCELGAPSGHGWCVSSFSALHRTDTGQRSPHSAGKGTRKRTGKGERNGETEGGDEKEEKSLLLGVGDGGFSAGPTCLRGPLLLPHLSPSSSHPFRFVRVPRRTGLCKTFSLPRNAAGPGLASPLPRALLGGPPNNVRAPHGGRLPVHVELRGCRRLHSCRVNCSPGLFPQSTSLGNRPLSATVGTHRLVLGSLV